MYSLYSKNPILFQKSKTKQSLKPNSLFHKSNSETVLRSVFKQEQQKTHSILIVDDDELFVELLQEGLETWGYRVTATTNSVKAFELFQKNPQLFDLVITDYNMPKMGGGQLAIKLNKIRHDIPIILATACNCVSQEDLNCWGINEVIYKPYPIEKMMDLVRKLILSS
jgi:CheY-like chemotaxis protein